MVTCTYLLILKLDDYKTNITSNIMYINEMQCLCSVCVKSIHDEIPKSTALIVLKFGAYM